MTTSMPRPVRPPLEQLAIAAMLGIVVVILIRTAWIAGDALVDLRTVSNALAGFGLRWNVAERVQTFTSPLWILLLLAGSWSAGNAAFVALLLNGVLTAGVVLAVFSDAADVASAGIAVLALSLCRAFVDYSTGGMPDALGNLLLATVLVCARRGSPPGLLALLVGLVPLARAPLLLILALPVIQAIRAGAPGRLRRYVALASLPSVAWLIFALFYYGLPFPAPFYATWFQPHLLLPTVESGAAYIIESLRNDPIAIALVGAASLQTLLEPDESNRAVTTGGGVYLLWVVLIGGSPLAGRLLAPAALAAAFVLARGRSVRSDRGAFAALAATLVLGCVAPHPTFRSDSRYGLGVSPTSHVGIRDERLFSYRWTGLALAQRYDAYPDVAPLERTVERFIAEGGTVTSADIGWLGYAAGSRLTILDPLGRTDVVGARREVPGAREYQQVLEATRDRLWSLARLRAVLRLNLSTAGGLRADRRGVGSQQAKQ